MLNDSRTMSSTAGAKRAAAGDAAALDAIGRRAATLHERHASAAAFEGEKPFVEPRLHRWLILYGRERSALVRRLSWDGMEIASLSLTLRAAPDGAAEWLEVVAEACAEGRALASETGEREPAPGTAESGAAPRFPELALPFVRVAGRRLRERGGGAGLAPAALESAQRHLLGRLAAVAELCWYREFDEMRGPVDLMRVWLAGTSSELPRERYRAFVDVVLRSMLQYLGRHPFLARQLARTSMQWVDALSEMTSRLDLAGDALRKTFGETGEVTLLEPGLSDRHRGGREVAALTFASGLRLVYKPRPVALERAFNELAASIAAAGGPALPHYRIVDCGTHGWCEWVEQESARSAAEVRAYFRAAGGLLVVAHLLAGKDLHMENVVATRRGPLLIDTESFLQPELAGASQEGVGALERAGRRLDRSALRTGLLTFLQTDAEGRVYDIGGLQGRGGYVATKRGRSWRFPNSDLVSPFFEEKRGAPAKNMLLLDGVEQLPEQHVDDLVEGFREMYRFAMEHAGELSSAVRTTMGGLDTRVILRPSNHYAAVVRQLVTPEAQQDGVAATIAADALNGVFRREERRPPLWPLARDEREALLDLDIPYFTMPVGERVIVSARGESVEGSVARTGLEVALERIEALSPPALEGEIEILQATLTPEERFLAGDGASDASVLEVEPLARGELIARGDAIVDQLLRSAVRGDDGSITWIAPSWVRMADREDRGVSYYLYDGAAGIALAFAAAARVTGSREHAENAAAALLPLRRALDSPRAAALLEREGLGACNGLGSVVYALTLASLLLGDGELLESASRAASFIDRRRIGSDGRLDVEGGAAGAVLALLALHRAGGDAKLLSAATDCAAHLVERAEDCDGGVAWSGAAGSRLTGFAHGSSGIALALHELARATANPAYAEVAARGFAHTSARYDAALRNWPVEIGTGESISMMAWCHGAPGIALALALARDESNERREADLDRAFEALAGAGIPAVDHLCCGGFGHAEILLTAGRIAGREDLVARGARLLAAISRRAEGPQGHLLRLSQGTGAPLLPGFFKGLAGLAYTYYRFGSPETVPSVLAFRSEELR
jgi:type 2 lantibiotic biosynthesis protein LanM